MNHIEVMSSYGTDFHDRILQAGKQDVRYLEIVDRLQQDDSTGTSTSHGTCTSSGAITSTCSGTGIGVNVQDLDYCLMADGLVRFRDRIYVSDNSELKKVILREFCVKPYLGHLGYRKTFTMNRFYYWPNLKKDVAEFLVRCLDCQMVKVESKHRGGNYSQLR